VGHFAWIKNLSRLVSSQLSKKEYKKYFCDMYTLICTGNFIPVIIFTDNLYIIMYTGMYTLNKNYKIFYNFS